MIIYKNSTFILFHKTLNGPLSLQILFYKDSSPFSLTIHFLVQLFFYVYSSSAQLSVSSTFVVVSTSVVLGTCVAFSISTVELSSSVVVS